MPTRQNQGFRKDLNFEENINDVQALSNLGGVGLAGDLRVMQNNLRNTSTIGYVTFSAHNASDIENTGFFLFPDREFVYTRDDVVGVSKTVSVGSTTLHAGIDYFVTNSNSETQFKLSFTNSDTLAGVSTVIVTSIGHTDFSFIRKDPVVQNNLIQFTEPDIQDDEFFGSYLISNVNSTFDSTQSNVENAAYFVTKKYKGTEDTTTDEDIKFEGTINLFDPGQFNSGNASLNDPKSPGIFIGDTRAFSSDNNPWSIDGTNLKTDSTEVTVGELLFANEINITGISQISASEVDVTTFTHKVPIVINGETYYVVMSPS